MTPPRAARKSAGSGRALVTLAGWAMVAPLPPWQLCFTAALSTIAASPPDLVLLDIMLPEVDGWEVLSAIRAQAHTRRIPVIVMTAKTMPADQVRAYNLGASGYMMKPFSPDEVVAKVAEALHDARPV